MLDSDFHRLSCPITQLWMIKVPPASELHEPAGEAPPPSRRHHHKVEQAVVHLCPSGRIEPRRVLPGVGNHHHRWPRAEYRLAVDDRMNHRRLEPAETSYHRKQVRKMIRWPTPIRREIVDHFGVEADRSH